MNGHFIGTEPEVITCYQKVWVDMIAMSIKHAKGIDLAELNPSMRMRECYEARCYLLSDQFERDCLWIGIDDSAIGAARKCWEYKSDNSRCAVCGKKEARGYYACGRKVCWEHWKIIEAYNKGYDLDEVMAEIEKEKDEPTQKELLQFEKVKRSDAPKMVITEKGARFAPKLTDEDRTVIRESYAKGRKARWLALRFGVTPRTINLVVKL